MAWRPHSRARISPESPRARGACDRCDRIYNHHDLRWQLQWSGIKLQNLRFLVCSECYDTPNPQLKARILPPDPTPILNARPFNYPQASNTILVTNDGEDIVTNDGNNIESNQ